MNEDDSLPSDYDLIVLGTGMPESILAAASARLGQSVLHIDRNEYYGGNWASFNFDQIQDWAKKSEESQPLSKEDNLSEFLIEGESIVLTNNGHSSIFNVHIGEYISNETEEKACDSNTKIVDPTNSGISEESKLMKSTPQSEIESETVNCETAQMATSSTVTENNSKVITKSTNASVKMEWTLRELKEQRRKFNLDLAPKLLFSRGPLVELLISSNISRYAEFKSATRVLTMINEKLLQVPCSRADVFSTKDVSIVEKRMLMKILGFCHEYQKHPEEYEGFENRQFSEFLKSKKLTSNVEHYLVHAIAMVDPTTPTIQALDNIQKFLLSLGRYGNSPFLWPIYGSGELPQCFCRLCAVFGGIYYLNRTVEAMILDAEGKCTGIISGRKRLNCKFLVLDPSFAPATFLPEIQKQKISRGIFVTNSSILPAEKEQLTLLKLPADDYFKSTITVLELSSGSCVCPKGLYVVHFTCVSNAEKAEDDLKPAMFKLFKQQNEDERTEKDSLKPKVLWSICFNQLYRSNLNLNQQAPTNVFLVSSPDTEQDYESTLNEAKSIFNKMNPGEEFLPRAPDPDEIILDSDNNPANETTLEEGVEAQENEVNQAVEAESLNQRNSQEENIEEETVTEDKPNA